MLLSFTVETENDKLTRKEKARRVVIIMVIFDNCKPIINETPWIQSQTKQSKTIGDFLFLADFKLVVSSRKTMTFLG